MNDGSIGCEPPEGRLAGRTNLIESLLTTDDPRLGSSGELEGFAEDWTQRRVGDADDQPIGTSWVEEGAEEVEDRRESERLSDRGQTGEDGIVLG